MGKKTKIAENPSQATAVVYQDDPNVLSVKGEIDLHVSPAITELLTAMTKEIPERVVIDLSGATYIDSAGLAALMVAMREVEAYGGKFFLAGLDETMLSILQSSRLDQTFRVFPDVDAALAAS
jgi:anti-sigma B factor antagonist